MIPIALMRSASKFEISVARFTEDVTVEGNFKDLKSKEVHFSFRTPARELRQPTSGRLPSSILRSTCSHDVGPEVSMPLQKYSSNADCIKSSSCMFDAYVRWQV